MSTTRATTAVLAAFIASVPATAQQQRPPRPAPTSQRQPATRTGAPESGGQQGPQRAPPRVPKDSSVSTHHRARIGGQDVAYTATAGTYVVRDDSGAPKASFFFVAYTKDGVSDVATRPVAFVFNGGPGSASLFTHMGLGPRRVALTDDGHGMPAPYRIVDNDDSFLDATDLVFIDAISTGYSRPVPGQNPQQFYGVVQDATWFSDFIYQYVTRNARWNSPKFLIGESYGTTRSAELAGILQNRHEMYLNGVVLLSSVAFSRWGADDRTQYFLPTYVTSAWYHHLLSPELQQLSADQIAQRAREFAHGEYAQALEKGDQLPQAEHDKVVQDMARLTALSPGFIERNDLRVSPQRWFAELQRDKRRIVGRLDSRFLGINRDAGAERAEYDPSEASYEGAYTATFMDYVRRELGWESDMYYTVSANVRPWDRSAGDGAAEVLRAAMTEQSTLKLLVLCGYYDLATPFNGIEETVSHMQLDPSIRKNVSFTYYESGHMVYIDRKAHDKLHKDVDEFILASSQN